MKNRKLKLIISVVLLIAASCDEPETTVTNIVHADGSITRRIEMKNLKNKFEISEIQVPFDSTWSVRDSLEIDSEGDTIWVKRAEKLYAGISELTNDYIADSGANKEVSRHAEFRKRFRWFNTEYRFAEVIDKEMVRGYPVSDFLENEELQWFYTPDNVTEQKENGPDSLKYRAFSDTVDKKTEKWIYKCIISELIFEFERLTDGKAGAIPVVDSLKTHEDYFLRVLDENNDKVDSLWSNGILLEEITGGSDALKFIPEADSALTLAVENVLINFKEYTVRTIMPGKLTNTNGFIDSSGVVLWPVKADFFLTQQYEMYSESQVINKWAWIITGIFVFFVLTGVILKRKAKG